MGKDGTSSRSCVTIAVAVDIVICVGDCTSANPCVWWVPSLRGAAAGCREVWVRMACRLGPALPLISSYV